MAIRDVFKLSRKTFFNPSGWLDAEGFARFNKTLWGLILSFFVIDKAERTETFEEAMVRLNLTEADVQALIQRYRGFALLFAGLAILTFGYSLYLLFSFHEVIGWLLGFAATALFLSQAFKYDFWSLQMRQRKLGLTFADWKRNVLGDKGNST